MDSSMRPALLRQRSNSTPQLGLVNVSIQEAGMIFSAAEKAAARRRRPMSEFSPGPSVLRPTHEQTIISPFDVQSTVPNRPTHVAQQPSTSSTLSTTSTSTIVAEPLPASIETGLEELAAAQNSTPPSSIKRAISSPVSSAKRHVPNPTLKAYADGLFLFTQSRLTTTVPAANMPIDLNLLVPHVQVDTPDATPEFEVDETRRHSRPPLKSRFSDWTATDTESVAEMSDIESLSFSSRRDSGVFTPDMEASGLMSPDSFFAEVTPKVSQTNRWLANMDSRASSPTRGCYSARQPASAASSRPRTRATSNASENFSYFAGFDSVSAATQAASLFPDMEVLQSPYTPSTQPPRSKRASRLSMMVTPDSIASDTVPLYRAQTEPPHPTALPVTPLQQMAEVDLRPPSWLVRAIG